MMTSETPMNVIDLIRPGDRVTITTPHGSCLTGTARIRNDERWVLDLGGRSGQPGIAKVENINLVMRQQGRGRIQVFPGSAPFPEGD